MHVYTITILNGINYNVTALSVKAAIEKAALVIPENAVIKGVTYILTLTDTEES